MLILSKISKHLLYSAKASKSQQEPARASKSQQEPAMTYCVCEGNNKNIFMRKMKKNNFYKHITIGEDDDYYGGIKEVCDNIGIDYTDYDYLSDLV